MAARNIEQEVGQVGAAGFGVEGGVRRTNGRLSLSDACERGVLNRGVCRAADGVGH